MSTPLAKDAATSKEDAIKKLLKELEAHESSPPLEVVYDNLEKKRLKRESSEIPELMKNEETPKKKAYDSNPVNTPKRPLQENNSGKRELTRRQKYLLDKAEGVELPTKEAAKLTPKWMYSDEVCFIRMCYSCRELNRQQKMIDYDGEHEQLPMLLCTICRTLINQQNRCTFFNYQLPQIKRDE